MADRRCTAKTKKGKRCSNAPIGDTDFCISHSPKEVQESAGFGGPQEGSGRPPTPKLIDIFRERLERAADKIMEPYFQALGVIGWDDEGNPIVDMDKAAMEIGRSNTGNVKLTDIADLGARIQAAERILDRVVGKPRQTTEVTGAGGQPLVPPPLPNDDDWHRKLQEAAGELAGAAPSTNGHGRNGASG